MDNKEAQQKLMDTGFFVSKISPDFMASRYKLSNKVILLPQGIITIKVNNDTMDHVIHASINSKELSILSLVSNGIIIQDNEQRSLYPLDEIQSVSAEPTKVNDKKMCDCEACRYVRGDETHQPDLSGLGQPEQDDDMMSFLNNMVVQVKGFNNMGPYTGQDPDDDIDYDAENEVNDLEGEQD